MQIPRLSRFWFFGFLFFLSSFQTFSQVTGDWTGRFFSGYSRSVTTGGFNYHSPRPDVNESLLLRSVDSSGYIAWETETVPAILEEPFVSFVWMFGIDANPDGHLYRLNLNGNYCLTFANPALSSLDPWTVSGINGCSLTFRTVMLDKYDDPMGYAVLKVPAAMVRKGFVQNIKITGESAASRVWYMTFESPVQESLDIVQEEAILRDGKGGKGFYSVLFNFVHLGPETTGSIEIKSFPVKEFNLQPGFNSVQILFPAGDDTSRYRATIRLSGKPDYDRVFSVHPLRHWTIYLVQHAHTDIGYTRPQTEILPEHLRYIDYALDYCDLTDSLPEDARFRWTCETSWPLREYITTRPKSQLDRLRKRVSEGRIELTGLFLNSSDLSDEVSIAKSLQPVRLFRESGFPVVSAMQDDINGVPWCLADYLPDCGIRYLTMGQNNSRARKPFDRPTLFWWESPSGNRLLVNRPEHYMYGNTLGILTNAETFGKSLFIHLADLVKKGYLYDSYSIQFSGYLTDNSPPSTNACQTVATWNQRYEWPHLKLATVREFMDDMLKHDSAGIPSYRGAWPDWWMDGFGSAAMETGYTRATHEDLTVNEGLVAMAKLMGIPIPERLTTLVQEITDDVLFYDEHTFGAAECISDPLVENSVVQWNEKAAYAWDAVKKNGLLREGILGLLQEKMPRADAPTVTVFNTLGWKRSGIVRVYIDKQLLPAGGSSLLVDENGNDVPFQRLESREEGSYWAIGVRDVPAAGYKTYRIVPSRRKNPEEHITFPGSMENEHYRIAIDPKNGMVTSIYDKELKQELFDPSSTYSPGSFIYETLGKNRAQLEQLMLTEVKRTVPSFMRVEKTMTDGPVWQSVRLQGAIPGCADSTGIRCEIRLYRFEKKIEFRYSMIKLPVTDPEGGYVAFPFRLNDGHIVLEISGAPIVPGKDQLAGSASDWTGVQNFMAVKNRDAQIVLVTPEVPLVQPGGLNLGEFARISAPETNHLYSWVFNNYWTTNFRAYQEGELKWNYLLTSGSDTSNRYATSFGWNERMPMTARTFPARGQDRGGKEVSLFNLPENILLAGIRLSADRKGIILQLRELEGKTTVLSKDIFIRNEYPLSGLAREIKVQQVSPLEELMAQDDQLIRIHPYATAFVHLTF